MQEKKRGRTHSRWLLPAALVLAGAAWFENFTLSTSTVTAACAALPEAFSGLRTAIILIAMLVLCVAMSIRNYFFYWNRSDA